MIHTHVRDTTNNELMKYEVIMDKILGLECEDINGELGMHIWGA